VQVYHDAGHGFVECSRRFGFTHTAWIKAVQRKKLRVAPLAFQDRRRKYNWAEIQVYYDAGRSYRECRTKFKFCAASWTNAVRRGEIKPRRFGMPIAELLSSPKRNRKHVKSRLISAGLLQNSCQSCGLTEWREESLHMHLDHINGVRAIIDSKTCACCAPTATVKPRLTEAATLSEQALQDPEPTV
jgi:hypothetical protein